MGNLPKSIPKLDLYIYPDAARDIAAAMNLSDEEQNELYFEMAKAINSGSLQVRNPKTGGPSKAKSAVHVTVADINSWLKSSGYPYQWQIPLSTLNASPSASVSALKNNTFQSMNQLKPEDLSITFVGDKPKSGMGNCLLIVSARHESRRVSLVEMGLIDRRKGTLNHQGAVLLGFANKTKLKSSTLNTKKMMRLRIALKSYFGISSDMFFPYNKIEGWIPRFKVLNKLGAADERAKIEAEQKTVSLDQMNESGEKIGIEEEYIFMDEDDEAGEFLKNTEK